MIKKKTAALFILLANIILQAHAVVPHHHLPRSAFVVISSFCHENNVGQHHPLDYPDNSHNQSRNNDNKTGHCISNKYSQKSK